MNGGQAPDLYRLGGFTFATSMIGAEPTLAPPLSVSIYSVGVRSSGANAGAGVA
jgi:hypothetical protein